MVIGVWIGTYPPAGAGTPPGQGEGVWRGELDLTAGTLTVAQVAQVPAASFLAVHPGGRVLYAVGETTSGTVSVLDVTPDGGVRPRDRVGSGGADPCHLLLAPDARTLYVANYSSGTVGVLPLEPDGGFTAEVRAAGAPTQVLAHEGSGPDRERQEGPHAHSTLITPDGAHLLVVDLGTDTLWRYRRAGDGSLVADGTAAVLPAGTGPRHATFAADGGHLYLTGELSATVHVLAWDATQASGRVVQSLSVGRSGPPDARPPDGQRDYPAHLALTGDRLVVSVRGSDRVHHLDVVDGLLRPAGDVAAGRWPRHLAVLESAGTVLVAAERGHELVPVGTAGTPHAVPLPSPACVVAAVPIMTG
ncbi:beta-propeller fold lactonase family protein [Actinotalea sp. K2]|uniref:lactonase family protein n=1 Tax=Actinotalea sp. K2 TaxID=2939438 RepID=UPI002016DE50|nr:beta-propeller fold lactonase family protein [Actinotalea sp. K2]MCL3861473.1 lactonase family protein [Actinotalea sp. K2]